MMPYQRPAAIVEVPDRCGGNDRVFHDALEAARPTAKREAGPVARPGGSIRSGIEVGPEAHLARVA